MSESFEQKREAILAVGKSNRSLSEGEICGGKNNITYASEIPIGLLCFLSFLPKNTLGWIMKQFCDYQHQEEVGNIYHSALSHSSSISHHPITTV